MRDKRTPKDVCGEANVGGQYNNFFWKNGVHFPAEKNAFVVVH